MDDFDLKFGYESDLAKQVRQAMGVGDYEQVRVLTPQFERTDGKKVYYFPKTANEFDSLKRAPLKLLCDMGLCVWESENSDDESEEDFFVKLSRAAWVHLLYPAEWYNNIPGGYEIFSINYKIDDPTSSEKFRAGETSDDKRFGCLAYGFIWRPNNTELLGRSQCHIT